MSPPTERGRPAGAASTVTTRTTAIIARTSRAAYLREVGHFLHVGGAVDQGWMAVQLWDFADLLEAVGYE